MGKTNTAAWLPPPGQPIEYCAKVRPGSGEVTKERLQRFFRGDDDFVILPLILEGSYTASELISMSGCDFSDGLITDERFPLEKHAPVERVIELVEFDGDPTTEEVLAEFERLGLRRPTTEEALYCGVEYLKEPGSKNYVVFLHEPVDNPRMSVAFRESVLVLEEVDGKWHIELAEHDIKWRRHPAFAGVRK